MDLFMQHANSFRESESQLLANLSAELVEYCQFYLKSYYFWYSSQNVIIHGILRESYFKSNSACRCSYNSEKNYKYAQSACHRFFEKIKIH